jgi:hypothetical protein
VAPVGAKIEVEIFHITFFDFVLALIIFSYTHLVALEVAKFSVY